LYSRFIENHPIDRQTQGGSVRAAELEDLLSFYLALNAGEYHNHLIVEVLEHI
jgi:hypothetical protein